MLKFYFGTPPAIQTDKENFMKRKILLALDDSVHSREAVRYVAKLSTSVKELSFTLFNVQPPISQFLTDEAKTGIRAKGALERVKKKNAENAQAMLEKHRIRMIETGIDEGRIDVKTRPRKAGLAKDVLEHALEKRYDSIVVGRRGLSCIQEVFMGSLTTNLVEHSKVIPVWIVDGEAVSGKIMIAIDGSESTLRAVDHFCFMAGDNPDLKVTLLHVVARLADFCKIDFSEKDEELEEIILKGDKKCVEDFIVHAYKRFKEAGIRKEQIEIKEVRAIANVGKAITEEAEKGDYGTVVVGRRGIGNAFFMGSVSKYVLDKTSDRAFWLVP